MGVDNVDFTYLEYTMCTYYYLQFVIYITENLFYM